MSTVLKAVEELERQRAGEARRLPLPPGEERRHRVLLAAGALLLLAAVSVLLFGRSRSSGPTVSTVAASRDETGAKVPAIPSGDAVERPLPKQATAPGGPPERRDQASARAPRVEDVAVATADVESAVEEPPRGQILRRPAPRRMPQKFVRKPAARKKVQKPVQKEEPKSAPLPPVAIPREPATASVLAEPAAGQMGVALRSIAYSSDAKERTATIDIEGTGAVTLREGQAAAGVEVQLILSDVVYVYRDGMVFGLSPER